MTLRFQDANRRAVFTQQLLHSAMCCKSRGGGSV